MNQPTSEDYAQIAQGVAPLIRKEASAEGSAYLSAQAASDSGPAWLKIEANGRLNASFGDLNMSLSAACEDANGVLLNVCDATTNSASIEANLSAALNLPNYSAEVETDVNLSFDGLQTATWEASGQCSFDAAMTFKGLFRPTTHSFDLSFDAAYDLTIPSQAPLETKGTLRGSIDARRLVSGTNNDSDAHFLVDALVTFDGDGSAQIVLDGDAKFELNLETGALVHIEASAGG